MNVEHLPAPCTRSRHRLLRRLYPFSRQSCTVTGYVAALLLAAPAAAPAPANLVQNSGFETGRKAWTPYAHGFAVDSETAHTGRSSARLQNTGPTRNSGARQIIVLDQTRPEPLLLRAWSRAENVRGVTGTNYSVYADIEFTTDTRPGRVDLPGLAITFAPGTHDWQQKSRIIATNLPIREIRLYLLFRNGCTGAVWFDDVELRPLSESPLSGAPADLPPISPDRLPPVFRALLDRTNPGRFAVCALSADDSTRIIVQNRPLALHEGAAADAFPPAPVRFSLPEPDTPASSGLRFCYFRKQPIVELTAGGAAGGTIRWFAALPAGTGVQHTSVTEWDVDHDEVRLGRVGDRAVIQAALTPRRPPVRLRLYLSNLGAPRRPSLAPPQTAARIATDDGLTLEWSRDARIAALRIGTRRFPANSANRDTEEPAGFSVADFYGLDVTVLTGRARKKEDAVLIEAGSEEAGLRLRASLVPSGNRIDVTATVEDRLRRGDRALDLLFNLPLDLAGWTWHDDITTARTLTSDVPVESNVYPWAVVTPPDRGAGIVLVIAPDAPCTFRFRADAKNRRFQIRFPLALVRDARIPWTARVRFSIFTADGRWGFRDAARRYYAAFPRAFRRTAPKDGGWLFACPTARVPDPQDYAYHEGGPAGWELDEKLGILTCPYRIPTQRQIVLPRLPDSDDEARAWIRRLAATLIPARWRLRGESAVAAARSNPHSGEYCLQMSRKPGDSAVWAVQDVVFDPPRKGPFIVSGWCRSRDVTGAPDRNFALYADVFPVEGPPLFAQNAPFDTGTHDWQQRRIRIDPKQPVQKIRLYLLMRGTHSGTAWFDDIEIVEPNSRRNYVRNNGFEQAAPHSYARMMLNCAAHDAAGRMYITRRDDVGADVRPKHPIYNIVTPVNCDPDLFADQPDRLTVGRFEIETILDLFARYPGIDGIYLDSVSGWISRRRNYRREHFPYLDAPLCYDPQTGAPFADGWVHTYEFLEALQRRLVPLRKVVFPNVGRGRRLAFLYFVSDVIGLEGGLRRGEFEPRLNFYRTLAYHKPVLVMDYLEVIGRPTRFNSRSGFERLWKWCTLYGAYPSIGRSCVEAWTRFSDVYQTFREPLRKLTAAGWEPVPYATADPGARIERFGSAKRKQLLFTVFNPGAEARTVRVRVDARDLGLKHAEGGLQAVDLMTGQRVTGAPWVLNLAPEGLAVLEVLGP